MSKDKIKLLMINQKLLILIFFYFFFNVIIDIKIIIHKINNPISKCIDSKRMENKKANDKFLKVSKPKINVLREYAIRPLVCTVNIKVG